MKYTALFLLAFAPFAFADLSTFSHLGLNEWSEVQRLISTEKTILNMSLEDGLPGATIASPERVSPNYYFHWVRDSALTYMTTLRLYEEASGNLRALYKQRLLDFADFSAVIQSKAGLGKAKFHVDGTPFTGPWCEPQNDGPALRAITLMKFAHSLWQSGEQQLVRDRLLPVIQKDIAFVKNVWPETSCDLWEELYGHHFYTRMVQRRALYDAMSFASLIDDTPASLKQEADALGREILRHWDDEKGFFVTTLNFSHGLDTKKSNLDASIVIAILHGYTDDGFLGFDDERVLKSVQAVMNGFNFYHINQRRLPMGPAIGRYPEDHYYGGNPWVLLTAATGQFYYRAALQAKANGQLELSNSYLLLAENQMKRVKFHAPSNGALAEQMDRHSGYMMAAPDLTWSHTEVLDALSARDQALGLNVCKQRLAPR